MRCLVSSNLAGIDRVALLNVDIPGQQNLIVVNLMVARAWVWQAKTCWWNSFGMKGQICDDVVSHVSLVSQPGIGKGFKYKEFFSVPGLLSMLKLFVILLLCCYSGVFKLLVNRVHSRKCVGCKVCYAKSIADTRCELVDEIKVSNSAWWSFL